MKAVIDTNVLIAGLLWRGPPHALLEHVRAGTVSLVSSPALLAELADVIGRSKFDAILTKTNTSRERSLAEVRQLAEVIEPPPLPQAGVPRPRRRSGAGAGPRGEGRIDRHRRRRFAFARQLRGHCDRRAGSRRLARRGTTK